VPPTITVQPRIVVLPDMRRGAPVSVVTPSPVTSVLVDRSFGTLFQTVIADDMPAPPAPNRRLPRETDLRSGSFVGAPDGARVVRLPSGRTAIVGGGSPAGFHDGARRGMRLTASGAPYAPPTVLLIRERMGPRDAGVSYGTTPVHPKALAPRIITVGSEDEDADAASVPREHPAKHRTHRQKEPIGAFK
jgi:hypothetical protein